MAATVAGWIAYAALRGDTVADDADSATALVRAQDYIQHRYLNRLLPGLDAGSLEVADPATYEAAKLELATPGFWNKTFSSDQQKVLTEVKGIKWTVRGDASGTEGATPTSTLIDAMFAPFVTNREGPSFGFLAVGRTSRP